MNSNYYNPETSNKIFKTKLDAHIKIVQLKTGLTRKNLLIIFSSALVLIFLGVFENFVSKVITIYFPIIWTANTLEEKKSENIKQWLSYWSIFGIFCLIDQLYFIINIIFPFYTLVKTIILLYMYLPNYKGAIFIYDDILSKHIPKKYFGKKDESLTEELVRIITQKQIADIEFADDRDANTHRNRSNVITSNDSFTTTIENVETNSVNIEKKLTIPITQIKDDEDDLETEVIVKRSRSNAGYCKRKSSNLSNKLSDANSLLEKKNN